MGYFTYIKSAGAGSTGTLIALDILLDEMDAEGSVDIKQCVTKLRQQRTRMVENLVCFFYRNSHLIIFHASTCINRISYQTSDSNEQLSADVDPQQRFYSATCNLILSHCNTFMRLRLKAVPLRYKCHAIHVCITTN